MAVSDSLESVHAWMLALVASVSSAQGWASSDTGAVLDELEQIRSDADGWLSGDEEEVTAYLIAVTALFDESVHLENADKVSAAIQSVTDSGAHDVDPVENLEEALRDTYDDFMGVAEFAGEGAEDAGRALKATADAADDNPYVAIGAGALGVTIGVLLYQGIRKWLGL